MNPKRQHFRLGRIATADVRTVWSNGELQTHTGVSVNQSLVVRQGIGIASSNTGTTPAASDS
jgi:hypothetical protein